MLCTWWPWDFLKSSLTHTHTHTHTHTLKSHVQYRRSKQQWLFLFPRMRAITLERGQLLYLLLCVHFRQLFSGPQHKRSQMYFLTTEVRQARHQRPSSSQCLRERQSSARSSLMDKLRAQPPSSPHSPHAATRQNRAQLNYKQIDSHIMP